MLLLHRPSSLRIRLDQRPLRTMAELVAKRRRTDSPVQGLQSHSSEVICSHESSHQVKVQGGLICTDHFFSTQLDYTGEVSYETTISTDHHQEAIRGYGTQLMSLHASLPSLARRNQANWRYSLEKSLPPTRRATSRASHAFASSLVALAFPPLAPQNAPLGSKPPPPSSVSSSLIKGAQVKAAPSQPATWPTKEGLRNRQSISPSSVPTAS
jgi:hypothetical protein